MPNKPPRDKARRYGKTRPVAAGQLLQGDATGLALAAIRQGAAAGAALRQRLLTQLPEVLHEHVTAAIAKPGELVVFVDAAVWAARLKLALAETPPQLAPEVPADARLTVRVMPGGQLRR